MQKNDLHRARVCKDRYFFKRLLLVQICIDLLFYQRILTIRRFICATENNYYLVPIILIGILEMRRNIRSSMRVDRIKSIGTAPNIQLSQPGEICLTVFFTKTVSEDILLQFRIDKKLNRLRPIYGIIGARSTWNSRENPCTWEGGLKMYKRHIGQVSMLESLKMFSALPMDLNNDWIKLSKLVPW